LSPSSGNKSRGGCDDAIHCEVKLDRWIDETELTEEVVMSDEW
jgi:hypothetical protein